MKIKLTLFIFGALLAVARAEDSKTNVTMTVVRPGIYKTATTDRIADTNVATGNRRLLTEWKLVVETNRVPATLDLEFGFGYRFDGAPAGAAVMIETVCIYAGDGVKPPGEAKPHKTDRYTRECHIGETGYYGFQFENQWELVTGKWTVQHWCGKKKLSEVKFTVVAAPPWPGVTYSEVRGYAYNLKGDMGAPILTDGKLHDTVINKDGAILSKNQVRHLLDAVTGDHPSHPVAACFNPRHAFIFYDDSKKPVAQIEICFECLEREALPEGIAGPLDWPALAELCTELKLANSPDKGFRKWFNEFRREFK